MAYINLQTSLTTYVYSSQLDVVKFSTDFSSVVVEIRYENTCVYSTTLSAIGGLVTFYDVRSIIEEFMMTKGMAFGEFDIWAEDEDSVVSSSMLTFYCLYMGHNIMTSKTCEAFLKSCFLETENVRMSFKGMTEGVNYVTMTGESITMEHDIVYSLDDGIPVSGHCSFGASTASKTEVTGSEWDYSDIQYEVGGLIGLTDDTEISTRIRIMSLVVHAGDRVMAIYYSDETADKVLCYYNPFNILASVAFRGVTRKTSSMDVTEAECSGKAVLYDRTVLTEYETEVDCINRRQGERICQALESPVQYIGKSSSLAERIIITDYDCELSDERGEMNSIKFTYRYLPNRPVLDMTSMNNTSGAVFSSQFTEQFS